MQNNPWVKLHVTEHLLFNVLISYFALHCAEFKLLLTSSAPSECISVGELVVWPLEWVLALQYRAVLCYIIESLNQ